MHVPRICVSTRIHLHESAPLKPHPMPRSMAGDAETNGIAVMTCTSKQVFSCWAQRPGNENVGRGGPRPRSLFYPQRSGIARAIMQMKHVYTDRSTAGDSIDDQIVSIQPPSSPFNEISQSTGAPPLKPDAMMARTRPDQRCGRVLREPSPGRCPRPPVGPRITTRGCGVGHGRMRGAR